ncbi:hypothetical protein LOZ80_36030 [Paenibacillus sp. HWE-109]|uniref:hypothetical protein n=1 Tax=Paenibacillus sp. HWE-109 TaxID=1306526 RepID=UPI001EE03A55|nr:hypothetical protein [Paenibacillus sp. HWE-109]UKS26812.1 hypothetical protein LOZ80_36030 [Paenibacillus sp. HWE-109]
MSRSGGLGYVLEKQPRGAVAFSIAGTDGTRDSGKDGVPLQGDAVFVLMRDFIGYLQ